MTTAVTPYEEWYADQPLWRALVQLAIPGGGAYNTAIQGRVQRYRLERSKRLFDRLRDSSLVLTSEMIESEDFIHRFLVTQEAASRTYRHEKIDVLADLLAGSIVSGSPDDAGEYESLLRLLDELSTSELIILATIQSVEESDPWSETMEGLTDSEARETGMRWVAERRKAFVQKIQTFQEFAGADVRPFLSRLESKGLIGSVLGQTDSYYTAGERDTSFDGFDGGPFAFLTGLYATIAQAVRSARTGRGTKPYLSAEPE